MNVVVVTEFLHQKDWVSSYLEEILSIYPQALLMSLSYRPMSLGSKIESHTIVSSQVPPESLESNPWMQATLIRNLKIPKEIDLVVSLSRGFAHQVSIPEGAKHISYIIDKPVKQTGIKGFLDNFVSSPLKMSKGKAIYLSRYIRELYGNHDGEILNPFFKAGEHEVDKLSHHEREIDCVINISRKTSINVQELARELKGIKFILHGSLEEINHLVTDKNLLSNHTYQKGCHGTEQKLFENTRLFVDLTEQAFNPLCLQALSAGSALYLPEGKYEGIISHEYSMSFQKYPLIRKALESSWWGEFNSVKGRREALRYNARVFKRSISKIINYK